MTDPNTAPVTLAAGSYDYDALKLGLNKSARGAAKNYADNVDKALKEASENPLDERDSRSIPGYKFVEVEHKDLGVTESIQVFDQKLAEREEQTDPTQDVPPVAPENLAAAKAAAETQE
jgi:hypothetical protein